MDFTLAFCNCWAKSKSKDQVRLFLFDSTKFMSFGDFSALSREFQLFIIIPNLLPLSFIRLILITKMWFIWLRSSVTIALHGAVSETAELCYTLFAEHPLRCVAYEKYYEGINSSLFLWHFGNYKNWGKSSIKGEMWLLTTGVPEVDGLWPCSLNDITTLSSQRTNCKIWQTYSPTVFLLVSAIIVTNKECANWNEVCQY